MKKPIIILILCIVAMSMGHAQFSDGIVLQPTNVVAKQFDTSGQLIKEMTSTFSYAEDGKLTHYDFPDHSLWSTYSYNDNLLMQEYTRHGGGHPVYGEIFEYTYENYQVKTKSHLWDQMNPNEYWLYDYDTDGRIKRMDYKDELDDDYHMHWLYEYEDEGRTKIENYWTSWNSQGLLLRKKTVFQYDETYKLLSEHAENFSTQGVLTKTTLKTYSYTPGGEMESEVTQTLSDGEWTNTSIIRYVHDGNDRVTERQVGEWSDEIGDWNLTSKTTYELDEEESTLTVSFYKKADGEWVWDEYGSYYLQPVFYEPYLEEQQNALRFYVADDLFATEHVNQFVFTLAETNEPTYVGIDEKEWLIATLHPNPTTGLVTITGKNLKIAEVLNTLGQRVAMVQGQGETLRIDIANLPAGVYFVNVTDEEGRKCVRKVVKE